jgi:hypothetical protein
LHGRARVVESQDVEFASLQPLFPVYESLRSIIIVDVTRVSESCGFGVPLMRYEAERPQLRAWAESKGAEGLKAYRQEKNRVSVDGLPGIS